MRATSWCDQGIIGANGESGFHRRDLEHPAEALFGVAFGHADRVLVLLFRDSVFLELSVALICRHVDNSAKKGLGHGVSYLQPLTAVDVQSGIVASHALLEPKSAGRLSVLAPRAVGGAFVLALLVGLNAVDDVITQEHARMEI